MWWTIMHGPVEGYRVRATHLGEDRPQDDLSKLLGNHQSRWRSRLVYPVAVLETYVSPKWLSLPLVVVHTIVGGSLSNASLAGFSRAEFEIWIHCKTFRGQHG